MDLLRISVTSLNISSFIILLSVFLYFSFLVHRKEIIIKIAFSGLLIAELLITEALILRWIEAGFDHPPLANLYESLISFCWGILFIFLIIEGSKKTKFLGVLISPVILIGMGLASLTDNKEIEPLVPALQSIWLHLHVVTAIFGYGAFVLSAMFGLLYLLKAKVPIFYFQLAGLAITLISILGLSIESPIFSKLSYTMSAFTFQDNVKYAFPDMTSMTQEKFVQLRLEVPFAGTLFLIIFLTSLTLIIYNVWAHRTKPLKETKFFKFFLVLFTLTLFYILLRVAFFTPVKVGDKMAYLFLSSNPYEIALIFLTWIFNLLILLFGINLDSFLNLLPPEKKLEQNSYKMILLGFPLLSLLIITGAIWANYAWGRYWGWDPKETWSLITWFIYALYFHLRYRKGWIGKPTAIISIIGFIAVIFTYLGVNLLLSGLHSYGAG